MVTIWVDVLGCQPWDETSNSIETINEIYYIINNTNKPITIRTEKIEQNMIVDNKEQLRGGRKDSIYFLIAIGAMNILAG